MRMGRSLRMRAVCSRLLGYDLVFETYPRSPMILLGLCIDLQLLKPSTFLETGEKNSIMILTMYLIMKTHVFYNI